jgi:protein TonB
MHDGTICIGSGMTLSSSGDNLRYWEVDVLMSVRHLFIGVAVTLTLAVAGCDKDDQGSNARKAALPDEETETPLMSTVYKFNGSAKAVADMRRFATEEKWADALGAAEALLKEEPGHQEGQRILDLAKREGQAQLRLNDFGKKVAGRDVVGAVKVFKQIPDNSQYKPKAQADYEKLRDTWLASTEADVRAAVRASRCDDARRGARITGDLFPEGRQTMEAIAATCRGRVETEVASKGKEKEKDEPEARDEKPAKEKPTEVAMVQPSKADREREATPTAAAVLPPEAKVAVAAKPIPAAAPAPAAPAPRRDTRPVPLAELEKLRISGDRQPELPMNVKQIMKRDQVKAAIIATKTCINESGSVSSVTLMKGSEYDEANKQVIGDIKKWKFKPYLADGVAVPVCTAVVLNYQVNFSIKDRCKTQGRSITNCDN